MAAELHNSAGADLGKMLTDLLQNERRRRKLLGWSDAMLSRKSFNFNQLKCPFLAFWVSQTAYSLLLLKIHTYLFFIIIIMKIQTDLTE